MRSSGLVGVIQFGDTGDLRFASSTVRLGEKFHLLEFGKGGQFLGNTGFERVLHERLRGFEFGPEIWSL